MLLNITRDQTLKLGMQTQTKKEKAKNVPTALCK